MESLEYLLKLAANVIDWIGFAILLIGALKFLVGYVAFEFKSLSGRRCAVEIQNMRLPLGGYILLALEFMIISDIIHSALSRSKDDFLVLGLIVVIRTAIGFFLGKDLKDAKDFANEGDK